MTPHSSSPYRELQVNPRWAVLSHNNLLALIFWLAGNSPQGPLPGSFGFHVQGLARYTSGLPAGCCASPGSAAELFEFCQPFSFGVPTVYFRLLELPSRFCQESWKVSVCSSRLCPFTAQTLEDFQEMYGGTILERYGMSETMMNIGNPYHGERRLASGKGHSRGIVRIVDSEFNDVAEGETGELLVKGPNVFGGYWNRPEASAEELSSRWFRTGDLVFAALTVITPLKGRHTDLIISVASIYIPGKSKN